jgi:hypothetical protein
VVRVTGQQNQEAVSKAPLPELYSKVPGTEARMQQYCKHCGTDKTLVDSYLVNAELTIKQLKNGFSPTPSREKLKELMWYAMAQAASVGEEWMSGSFRVVDADGRLFRFIQACSDDEHLVYPRISSHMALETMGTQWGIDFEPDELPAKKQTLLFAQLKGNPETLYMKLEGHGCPPFWKEGFRTLHNFTLFCLHAIDYIRTRFVPSKKDVYETRKEHISSKIKRAYSEVMQLDQPKGILERIGALFSSVKFTAKVAGAEEGLSQGVSKMIEKLKLVPQSDVSYQKAKELLSNLEQRAEAAKARGYTGSITGNEVLLSPWS